MVNLKASRVRACGSSPLTDRWRGHRRQGGRKKAACRVKRGNGSGGAGVEPIKREKARHCYPFQIPWNTVFSDPILPLVVDIGSGCFCSSSLVKLKLFLSAGNGLFLFQMARSRENYNFLGLEMNEKLVIRCLQSLASGEKRNLYFVSTNATSTFRSIVSSYPGQLALITIQCPNPDFNKEQNRWRMVRRMLVEAVADLLEPNGKVCYEQKECCISWRVVKETLMIMQPVSQVYLQSDVESVLLGMKEQFISYSKGRLVVDGGDSGHQMENPFGVASDWERHVLARGAPMYRTMLWKV
ncbi:hypothetical protein PR202_ga00351 [Eleusine coracana subsp. coracana]|uniref:tRNA (guanine(46)-N(7))-methyltransferase n=1 Tax=Eleusine coracana subsp. coracana TaxID=191504 RepID=A0AAV5BCB6_ELECO|nr:hypothetical protein PR202_ga00351 [Eleusine coracana subsp. coracana]